jgi:hypothetical protein
VTPLAALVLTVAATAGGDRLGVQLVSADVRAEIVRPAIVRQASGLEERRDAPAAQITRRGRTILVEFQ